PMYLYLVWIDTDGKATPIYPWAGDWARPPAAEEARARLLVPEPPNLVPLGPGSGGVETLVLLARDSPLPAADRDRVREQFGHLPPARTADVRKVVWFRDGEIVRDADRAPVLGEAQAVDEPVLRTQ